MKNVVLFFMLIFQLSVAQNQDEVFTSANALYQKGSYQEALNSYKSLIGQDAVSSELYHNIANCYYKLNQVAPAIYNYEKALLLNPSNEDAKNNLIFAKRLTIDRIEELPETFLQRLNKTFLQQLHYDTWAILAIVFAFIKVALFLLFYFSYSSGFKRLFFVSSILSTILLLTTLSFAYHQYNKAENTVLAIIFVDEVPVKSEPTFDADEAFVLHEGTKVLVLDEVGNWKKIKLADGKIGWLKRENIQFL